MLRNAEASPDSSSSAHASPALPVILAVVGGLVLALGIVLIAAHVRRVHKHNQLETSHRGASSKTASMPPRKPRPAPAQGSTQSTAALLNVNDSKTLAKVPTQDSLDLEAAQGKPIEYAEIALGQASPTTGTRSGQSARESVAYGTIDETKTVALGRTLQTTFTAATTETEVDEGAQATAHSQSTTPKRKTRHDQR